MHRRVLSAWQHASPPPCPQPLQVLQQLPAGPELQHVQPAFRVSAPCEFAVSHRQAVLLILRFILRAVRAHTPRSAAQGTSSKVYELQTPVDMHIVASVCLRVQQPPLLDVSTRICRRLTGAQQIGIFAGVRQHMRHALLITTPSAPGSPRRLS